MRLLLLLCIVMSINCLGYGQFRSTKWGMSLDEVKAAEGIKLNCDSDGLCVSTPQKLAQFNVTIVFQFDNDKLIGGAYGFLEEYSNEYLYSRDYNDVESILTDKYGKPENGGVTWVDGKSSTLNCDKFIRYGECYYEHTYYTEDFIIRHNLTAMDMQIIHMMAYKDPNHQPDYSGF